MSEKEFSTFMDGEDCPDCTHYEKQIKQLQAENAQLKKRVEELEKNRKSTITKEDADRLVEASLESADSLRATLQKVFGN